MNNYDRVNILKSYDEGLSLREVALEHKLSPKTVKKIIEESGITIRTRGEQQSIEFKKGKRKKKPNSDETKKRISNGTALAWKKISKEKRAEFVENARARWNNISDDKKDEMREKAFTAIRETSKEGSRLENAVVDALRELGYNVKHHVKGFIPNEKLEVDILIPSIKTAIEIDGLSHFEPIWGEEALLKTQSADDRKMGLLLVNGYVMLRIKCMNNHLSDYLIRECVRIVTEEINKIKEEFPTQRFIERELK